MGDLSAEPSMEEILSSIKRIIAEEGDATPARQRRQQRGAAPPPAPAPDHDEVLELKDPVPQAPAAQAAVQAHQPQPQSQPQAQSQPQPDPAPARNVIPEPQPVERQSAPQPATGADDRSAAPEPILSRKAAETSRGSLETLSRLLIKPEPDSDGTLEGLVREMLKPMLRDWLDQNLPDMVQGMVAREIAKITGPSAGA